MGGGGSTIVSAVSGSGLIGREVRLAIRAARLARCRCLTKLFPNIVEFSFGHWTQADGIIFGEGEVAYGNILRIRIVIIRVLQFRHGSNGQRWRR